MYKQRVKLFICICFVMMMFVGCRGEESNYEGENSLNTSQNSDSSDVPEADMDTISKANKQLPSTKPLVTGNSQITMNVKNENNVLAIKIENKSAHKISFGGKYVLYRNYDNEWENIEYLPDVVITDKEYIVKKNEIFSEKISLLELFGELRKGKYKIEKEIELTDSRIAVSEKFEVK